MVMPLLSYFVTETDVSHIYGDYLPIAIYFLNLNNKINIPKVLL